MRDTLRISDVRFTAASGTERAQGLLGFVSLRLGELILDSLVVRRTRDARYVVGFPHRRDRKGFAHEVVRPTTHEVRRSIENEVIAELKRQGALP